MQHRKQPRGSCDDHVTDYIHIYLLDGDKILQRLAHLAPSDCEVSRVQEIAHPLV